MLLLSKILPLFFLPLGLSLMLCLWGGLRRKPRVVIAGVLILFVSSLPPVGRGLMRVAEQSAHRPSVQSVDATDAIVVLSAGRVVAPGPDRASEWTEANRFFGGLELFRAGKAPWLVFTGARSIGTPDAPTEGEVLADFAATLGVPVASMLVTGYVQNTADEARQAATALRERGLTTPRVLLVTSAVHMPRARAMFQQEGMVVTAFPVGFSSPADRRYSVRDLFPTTVALRHSETAIREFYGRAHYWLRDRF